MKSCHASPSLRSALRIAAASLMFWCAGARAQSSLLVDEVHTLATASQATPIEHSVSVTDAGTYDIQLQDVGAALTTPAPLAYVALAVTNGSTIVGTPLTAAGKTQFKASAAGTYVVRIVGQPGTTNGKTNLGSGPVLVTITNHSTSAVLTSFEDVLALAPSNSSLVSTVNDTFTVSASGNYTVTLVDWKFPQALAVVTVAVASPSTLLASPTITAGTAVGTPQTAPMQPNTTYTVFGVAEAASAAGIYTLVVRDPNGAIAYSRTVPVGGLTSLGSVALSAGTGYNLSFADLAVPAALSSSGPNGAIAVLDENNGVPLTNTGTGSSSPFTAVAGTYQVFGLGTPASSGGGSYAVNITPSAGTTPAPVFSVARAVTASGGTLQSYSYDTSVTTAGTYTVQLTDFQYPQALTSTNLVAVQNGASLATPLTAAGSSTVTPAVGNLSVLVFAQPPTGSGAVGGVFGLLVTPAAGGAPIYEGTQGVGSSSSIVFASRKASVTAAGSYAAQVTDVGFPTTFANFDVLVTQGTTVVGKFVNGGSLPITASAAADYFVTFTAQPALPSAAGSTTNEYQAGTYAIAVGAAPTATLSSSASQVASGGSIMLTWSSQNADTCTASGGWSGSQALSGTATETVTANTTYTLSCTGLGQTATQSTTVTVGSSSGGGGGGGHGGGSFDPASLAALAGFLMLRAAARRRRATAD